jgi:hypothetical protein
MTVDGCGHPAISSPKEDLLSLEGTFVGYCCLEEAAVSSQLSGLEPTRFLDGGE